MNGKQWTAAAVRLLRRRYPDSSAAAIARSLGCSVKRVYAKAAKLGLSKSVEYQRQQRAAEAARLIASGAAHRFPPGHVPWTKGKRMPGWAPGRMAETQFKKGGFPVNRDPDFYVLGALRVNADGYIDMRVSFEPGARGWRGLHTVLWEDAHGPVPLGHCLIFRNGDSLDVELGNLELITRAENMRRNSVHNLPPALKSTVMALGQFKRRVREYAEAQDR